MGRESTVTAEQVNAVADTIKAEGGKPTARAIRERLGHTGSMGTINRLFQIWKAGHTRQTSATLALPVPLQNTILDFMDQELTVARAALETELAEQQQEAADLAAENERQVETIDGLTEQVSSLSAEKASIEGKATQLADDLHTAHQEALTERQAAEHARTDLAKALLRLEAMPRLEDDLGAARAELGREHHARTEAERKAAVLQAQKDDVHARLAAVEDEVRRGRDELAALALAHRGEVESLSTASAAELARVREEAAAEIQRHRAEAGALTLAHRGEIEAQLAASNAVLNRMREDAATELQHCRSEAAARISEARADAARAAEQVQRMQERVDSIASELNNAHAEAKIAGEAAAELRGRLAATPILEGDGQMAAKPGEPKRPPVKGE